jgi:hypothetical protein
MKRILQMRITRWSFYLAIAVGLTVGAVNLLKAKQTVATLQAQLKQQSIAHEKTDAEIFAKIKTLKANLESATAEKDKALAKVAIQNEQIETLSAGAAKANHEKEESLAHLARYKASGLEPEQVAAAAEELKRLKAELAAAQEKIRGLTSKTSAGNKVGEASLPPGLRGRVLVVDPKWRFVVLDAGQEKGVVERGELLVTRNGRLIAKVVVSSVDKNRCIANVAPGWEFGEVLEGDTVAPAHPKS